MTINYELLKEAYAIIDGIPDDRFNLAYVTTYNADGAPDQPSPGDCGTVACAMGWLVMHPAFEKFGLRPFGFGNGIVCDDFGWLTDYSTAAGRIFGLPGPYAVKLFQPRRSYEYGTDKEIWQVRVKEFLSEHGQL